MESKLQQAIGRCRSAVEATRGRRADRSWEELRESVIGLIFQLASCSPLADRTPAQRTHERSLFDDAPEEANRFYEVLTTGNKNKRRCGCGVPMVWMDSASESKSGKPLPVGMLEGAKPVRKYRRAADGKAVHVYKIEDVHTKNCNRFPGFRSAQ